MPEKSAQNIHVSVLLNETVEIVHARSGSVIVDATLGLGGHTERLLGSGASVIAIDQDEEAIEYAKKRLEAFGDRVSIFHANFSDLKTVLESAGAQKVDGIIADLGVSSLQLDSESRGFSFRFDAPLDMRMDAASDDETAAELLARLPEVEIANLIYKFGEERFSRKIARWIVEKREAGTPIKTTRQLAELVERAVRRDPRDKIHPATRTFQALRIAVNRETEILEKFLVDSVDSLKTGGRLAVITFHSLEDRIVKQAFQNLAGKCLCPPRIPQCVCGARREVEVLTKKPLTPGEAEIASNPRSRSAKLRAVEKI